MRKVFYVGVAQRSHLHNGIMVCGRKLELGRSTIFKKHIDPPAILKFVFFCFFRCEDVTLSSVCILISPPQPE